MPRTTPDDIAAAVVPSFDAAPDARLRTVLQFAGAPLARLRQ
jgi:hypothetical protein